jgi:polar amino acid transport system substrate-binding protein
MSACAALPTLDCMRRATAFLLMLLLLAPAWACGPYRVAASPYPGLYQRSADGVVSGLVVDELALLSERSGCRLELLGDSLPRAWVALQSGQVHMLAAKVITPERERQGEFLLTAQMRPLLLMRRPQAPASRAAFDADPALRVAVVKGLQSSPELNAWLERLRGQGRLEETGDQLTALRLFELDRAQAIPVYPFMLVDRNAAWRCGTS